MRRDAVLVVVNSLGIWPWGLLGGGSGSLKRRGLPAIGGGAGKADGRGETSTTRARDASWGLGLLMLGRRLELRWRRGWWAWSVVPGTERFGFTIVAIIVWSHVWGAHGRRDGKISERRSLAALAGEVCLDGRRLRKPAASLRRSRKGSRWWIHWNRWRRLWYALLRGKAQVLQFWRMLGQR